jgi:lincosamide nucleotidyltransferase A/C/D/E
MMTADDVLAVMARLRQSGIEAWLDGGWGVDALLGQQTRDHDDLDLVVELARADAVCDALLPLGYELAEDDRPTRLVLTAGHGRSIDLHTVEFDAAGGGVQALPGGRSYRYPPAGFLAEGKIGGETLPCLTPEAQLECHTGYQPTDTDRHDVRLLADRFGLRLPPGYP